MLRIRHLLIHINTDKGVFGTKQNFGDGLNVIRAKNYAGKSQLVQSIMYALGMEGMQGPSHAVPLAHALTEYLDFSVNGKKQVAKVIDSTVSIEIENGCERRRVDDRHPEAARRHGMMRRILVFMKRDLHARHAIDGSYRVDGAARRMAIARAVRQKQHHAEAIHASGIRIIPPPARIQPDHRAHPSWAVKIGPLVRETQVRLDDPATDRFEVRHSGVTAEMGKSPVATPGFDVGHGFGMNVPIVERATFGGGSGGVSPPPRFAIDQRDIGRNMGAGQQRAPEMTGGECRFVVSLRGDHLTAGAHSAQVRNRLREHRERWWHHAMRRRVQTLR